MPAKLPCRSCSNSGGSAAEAFEQASSAASNAAAPLVPLAETVTKKGLDVVGPHLTVGVQRASDALSRFSDLAAP